MSTEWPPAAQADVVRAAQRDAGLVAALRASVQECAAQLLGQRRVQRYDAQLALAASALYYGLTTVAGLQTLGEEYCDIRQVEAATGSTPGWLRRVLLVLATAAVPYAIRAGAEAGNASLRTVANVYTQWVQPAHLALFYFFGMYYHVAKRITGIRYIFGRQLREGEHKHGYQLLGVLLAIQLAVQAVQLLRAPAEHSSNDAAPDAAPADDGVADANSPTCMLCFSPSVHPTSTRCGHIFCWSCVCRWTTEKPECPFCRRPVALSHLVPLYHI